MAVLPADILASFTLSNPDKAAAIGLIVAVIVFLIGYAVGYAKGGRRQREKSQQPVATLFNPSRQPDKYYS